MTNVTVNRFVDRENILVLNGELMCVSIDKYHLFHKKPNYSSVPAAAVASAAAALAATVAAS